jgi:hypothetical protein
MIFGLKQQKPFTVESIWCRRASGRCRRSLEGAAGNWQMLFPDNSTVTFAAGITDFSVGAMTPEGKLSATIGFHAVRQADLGVIDGERTARRGRSSGRR